MDEERSLGTSNDSINHMPANGQCIDFQSKFNLLNFIVQTFGGHPRPADEMIRFDLDPVSRNPALRAALLIQPSPSTLSAARNGALTEPFIVARQCVESIDFDQSIEWDIAGRRPTRYFQVGESSNWRKLQVCLLNWIHPNSRNAFPT